jgi:UDP-3-O-[3-hydroxymyristoyl] N-acetylglucosamine deacetylase
MSLAKPEVFREGWGLHTGSPSRVVLRRRPGPVSIRVAGHESPLVRARVVGTDRATTLEIEGRRVATVEHLLAAFAGLGLHTGVSIEVEGPELPLLDGAARHFAEAMGELGLPGSESPELEVARDDQVVIEDSSYTFRRTDGVHLEVQVDLPFPSLASSATWDGDAQDFVLRIAPARTFAFAAEIPALAEQGRVAHVSPESVVILAADQVLSAGRLFLPDEPARHKLLDLMGDLFLYGGPPRGALLARRPGHGRTHAAMREALERGIVRRASMISSPPDASTGR